MPFILQGLPQSRPWNQWQLMSTPSYRQGRILLDAFERFLSVPAKNLGKRTLLLGNLAQVEERNKDTWQFSSKFFLDEVQ